LRRRNEIWRTPRVHGIHFFVNFLPPSQTPNAISFDSSSVTATTCCNSPSLRLQLQVMASTDSNNSNGEQIQPRNFYIFGQGISFSMSPTIHNASFRFYNLPYTYAIHEAATVNELSSLISAPNFGGASVTTPHKVEIMKYCSSISEHAKNCGAINTLIRDELSSARMAM
jgi:Shikimate dehydrogenase substrate binding domain